jgi:hypothetical protein
MRNIGIIQKNNNRKTHMVSLKINNLEICLLMIFIGLFVLSCENSENEKRRLREKTIQDSISLVQERNRQIEQARVDSIEREEEIKVVGDIRFGMKPNDFEVRKDELMENCKVLSLQLGDSKYYDYKIGEYKFTKIYGEFYEGKLYFVQFSGKYTEYKYYEETMKKQAVALYKVLSSKYGEPVQDYGIPVWYTLKDGDSYCAAYWKLGDKVVQMKIENFRSNYFLNLEMFQSSISSKLEKEKMERENKKEKEIIQKATDIL